MVFSDDPCPPSLGNKNQSGRWEKNDERPGEGHGDLAMREAAKSLVAGPGVGHAPAPALMNQSRERWGKTHTHTRTFSPGLFPQPKLP